MPKEVELAICTLRRADPNVEVAVSVAHVAKYHAYATSGTVVKRVLQTNGLARRRGPVSGAVVSNEQLLELGGMKLVEAALVETGYLKALAVAVKMLALMTSPLLGGRRWDRNSVICNVAATE